MTDEAKFSCNCKRVKGRLLSPSMNPMNSLVCYCDACSAFGNWLDKTYANVTNRCKYLDDKGGSFAYQAYKFQIKIDDGLDQIRVAKFKSKDATLSRYYTECCGTGMFIDIHPKFSTLGIVPYIFQEKKEAQKIKLNHGKPVHMFATSQAEFDTDGNPYRGATFTAPMLQFVSSTAMKLISGWFYQYGKPCFIDQLGDMTPTIIGEEFSVHPMK